jgi:hypothetical protein
MAKKTGKGKSPKATKPQPTPKAEPAALVPGRHRVVSPSELIA